MARDTGSVQGWHIAVGALVIQKNIRATAQEKTLPLVNVCLGITEQKQKWEKVKNLKRI